MKRTRIGILVLLLGFCVYCLAFDSGVISADSSSEAPISFIYSFKALVGPAQDRQMVRIVPYNTLQEGDMLKIQIQLKTKCFVYLFYQSPENQVFMLFPYTIQAFEKDYQIGKTYEVPPGRACFTLDNSPGTEVFYLLASANRMKNLESAYAAYEAASVDKKQSSADLLLSHIRKLEHQHTQLVASAERPVPIGGNVRGMGKKQTSAFLKDPHAIKVNATDVYIQSFTINHQ